MRITAGILTAVLGTISMPGIATGGKVIILSPDEIKWQAFGLWQRAVLVGDSSKPDCPSTVRYKVPVGTRVPEHALEQDQTSTVLTGTMMMGIGEKWDDTKLKAMHAGSFYIIPAHISHFKTNSEEVIYQSSVIGPGGKGCPKISAATPVMLNANEMQWQQWGINAQRVVLAGDGDKFHCPPYTARTKYGPNTRIPEHPDDEDRTYTVLSGNLYVGIGDKWDDKKLRKMPASSFIAIPGGVSRYFKTEGEVVVQTSATGFPRGNIQSCN
ncbi:MAG TPA: cupin domain-containing protein [Burkholderiales bacterium]|nr:cupin domain-containing protein [Burkholderiales bacterium]